MATVGKLCAQSDTIVGQQTDQSDRFFRALDATNNILDDYRRYADNKVKIAILDTGIDMTHPQVKEMQEEASEWKPNKARVTSKSFIESIKDGEDHNGHGTHIAVTVMRIAKWAEVYVATVSDAQGEVNVKSTAKALSHAIHDWNVHIISMSFGFDKRIRNIERQLIIADRKNILLFAAVSNGGTAEVRQVAWPASMTKVFGVNSADYYGNTSKFNPGEDDNDAFSRYKFLGEGVRSAWPVHLGKNTEMTLDGTSMATPVAAATAALFLEFMRQNIHNEKYAIDAVVLPTPEGMKAVFKSIGRPMQVGDYFKYVAPWLLLRTTTRSTVESDRERILGQIREALWDLRIDKIKESSAESSSPSSDPGFLSRLPARTKLARRRSDPTTQRPLSAIPTSARAEASHTPQKAQSDIGDPEIGQNDRIQEAAIEREEAVSDTGSSYWSDYSEEPEPRQASDMIFDAEDQMNDGNPEAALEILQRLLTYYEQDWYNQFIPPRRLYLLMGDACMARKLEERDFDQLKLVSRALLARNPRDPDGLYWRGRCLIKRQRITDATVCFTAALAYDPQMKSAIELAKLTRKYEKLSEERRRAAKAKDWAGTAVILSTMGRVIYKLLRAP